MILSYIRCSLADSDETLIIIIIITVLAWCAWREKEDPDEAPCMKL